MFLEKFVPDLYESLGGFLALIVVNCIILGRAEAFANKHTVVESAVDGIANGLGFTAALTVMGVICEFLGNGSLFGYQIMEFRISMLANPQARSSYTESASRCSCISWTASREQEELRQTSLPVKIC